MGQRVFYALALLILLLDQATKAWLRATIAYGESVPLLPGVFHITHTRNTGAAFSLFQGATYLLALAALVVIMVIIRAQRRAGAHLPLSLALALALPLGGALGNLVDRLRLGYVTDLFDFTLINFPVFNVADSAITVGIVILIWRTFFVKEGEGQIIAATDAPSTGDAPAA